MTDEQTLALVERELHTFYDPLGYTFRDVRFHWEDDVREIVAEVLDVSGEWYTIARQLDIPFKGVCNA